MKKRVLLMIMCVFAITAASAQINSVAIVGAGIEPGGWPGEANNPGPLDKYQMTQVDAENWIYNDLTLVGGGVKFRANNAWSGAGFEWAGPFPSGVGTSSGDIIAIAGTYVVKLNTTTGAYSFESSDPIPTVKLVGSAVVDGTANIAPTSATTFQAKLNLLDGSAQFDVDGTLLSDEFFPDGIAGEGLPAIPVTAGKWIVKYNSETGEYYFEVAPNEAWAITGSALKTFGYDWGTDLLLDTTDGITYTSSAPISLEAGGFKFRVAGDWNTAKGCDASDDNQTGFFPTGLPGGKNINVTAEQAGSYSVTFNANTGEYSFEAVALIPIVKLVGTAVNNGTVDITPTSATTFQAKVFLLAGTAKFDVDGVLISDSTFPSGTAAEGFPSIPVTAGEWIIKFNSETGEYSFEATTIKMSVAIVGDGIEPEGWPGQANNPGPLDKYQMTQVDADNWIYNDLTVVGGGVKFRANNAWFGDGFEWAGPFPSGVGTKNGNIDIIAGTYTVKLNTVTGAYSFESGVPIPVVKLVGKSVDGGSVDIAPTSATTFQSTLNLLDGDAAFEVDGVLLSEGFFPKGIASDDVEAPLIPVTAGQWIVKYNSETREYSFEVPAWAMTGSAIKNFGTGYDWGTDLIFNTKDGVNYTYSGIDIAEGGFKFREAGLWSTAKGCNAFDDSQTGFFPSGDPGGKNINVAADQVGMYDVTFNRITGAYLFTKVTLSTKGFSTANFKVSPNPTTNNWNFTTENDRIESIQILDVLGKNVMSISPRSNTANVDASSLTRGIYFAKVTTAKATQTLKLMKN